MFDWKVERRVVLFEESGEWELKRQVFRGFEMGVLVAEIDVLVFEPVLLGVGLTERELGMAGCGGLGRMLRELFGDVDRLEMLGFLSRQIGKFKAVDRIYWVERVFIGDVSRTEECVKGFVYGIEKRLLKYRGMLVFGVYEGVGDLFGILDGMGFRCVGGLDYRYVGRADRKWDVNFEMYLAGF